MFLFYFLFLNDLQIIFSPNNEKRNKKHNEETNKKTMKEQNQKNKKLQKAKHFFSITKNYQTVFLYI